MGKIFNKGLDKDDKKEGLFKRLENIKDKNEENFINDEEKSLLLLKKIYFHWTVCVENEWKEKDIPGNEKFIPKTFKLIFLENNNQTELSEKEDELLYRYFKYKNIDKLVVAFNNTKTDEKLYKLFDKIVNRLKIFKKLINIVSNITEKERIMT